MDMDFLGFDGQKGPIRDVTVCGIRCVYIAQIKGTLNGPWHESDGTCENSQVSAASCKLVPLG